MTRSIVLALALSACVAPRCQHEITDARVELDPQARSVCVLLTFADGQRKVLCSEAPEEAPELPGLEASAL